MWDMVAKEMELPWRAVESMHWQMGQEDLASRANVPVFQPHITATTTKPPSNKRKFSKSPPTVGSDSSHGRGPTPSASSSAITRVRRSNSGAQHARKRTDSKTDKTGLDPLSAVTESDVAATAHSSPIQLDYATQLQDDDPHHHHARDDDDSGGSAGAASVGSEREWGSHQHEQEQQTHTTTGSTPRARSGSLASEASSGGAQSDPDQGPSEGHQQHQHQHQHQQRHAAKGKR
jgi:hypothetical protein